MNRRLPSDYSRRVHLNGVGDVERPVDIDQRGTGFDYLVSLRIYRFLQGHVINGEAEGDEVCVVFLNGDLTVEVTGEQAFTWKLEGRRSVFEGLPYALYLPPRHHYRLTLHTDAEVAYARARATGRRQPRLIQPGDIPTEAVGSGSTAHQMSQILAPGDAEHLICMETRIPGGHWSPYPAHKHDMQSADEAELEELTYCRFKSGNGFALQRLYGDGFDEAMSIRDGDTIAIKRGYHTVAVAPGCTLYSLHVLAGPGAADWRTISDGALGEPSGS